MVTMLVVFGMLVVTMKFTETIIYHPVPTQNASDH